MEQVTFWVRRVNRMVPVRFVPSVKLYVSWPLVQVLKLNVALPTACALVTGGRLKLPPVFGYIVSAASGCPDTAGPRAVYQRWWSAPPTTVS